MCKTKQFTLTLIGSFLIAMPVLADTWHKGYGETVTEATDNASTLALDAVRDRGLGCVDKAKKPVKDGDLWLVEVHQSYHSGSCGQRSPNQQLWDQYSRDAIKTWVGL